MVSVEKSDVDVDVDVIVDAVALAMVRCCRFDCCCCCCIYDIVILYYIIHFLSFVNSVDFDDNLR